jgi:hypothetical protein
MKIINNFLNKDQFKIIQDNIFCTYFPWYLQNGILSKEDGHRQFVHNFYNDTDYVNSSYFELLKPILQKLKIKALLRIKANLLIKTNKIIEHGFHCDFKYKGATTAIFYMNTNNGYTKFKKNNTVINSEENKLIYFNNKMEHTGSTCTDKDFRIVINFNYF